MEDFELCKKVCEREGCYYPNDSGLFHSEIADTPHWIRVYFEAKGKQ